MKKTARWIDKPDTTPDVTPSHFGDVAVLALQIAQRRGRSEVTPFDLRIARDRLAPRRAA